jgi:hypothetical protein
MSCVKPHLQTTAACLKLLMHKAGAAQHMQAASTAAPEAAVYAGRRAAAVLAAAVCAPMLVLPKLFHALGSSGATASTAL